MNISGCGSATTLGVVSNIREMSESSLALDVGMVSAQHCQAVCRDHDSCEFFSYEYQGFPSFEMSSTVVSGLSNSLNWLLVAGHDITCFSHQIYQGDGVCVSCAAGFEPVKNKCKSCPSGRAGVDGLCVTCATGKVPNPESTACAVSLPCIVPVRVLRHVMPDTSKILCSSHAHARGRLFKL